MQITQDYLHDYGLKKAFYPAEDSFKKILIGKVLLRKSYDASVASLSHFVTLLDVKTSSRYRTYLLELDLSGIPEKASKESKDKAISEMVISRLTQSLRTFLFNGVNERNRFEFEFKLLDFLERFERLSYEKNVTAVTALYKEFYDAVQSELRLGDTVLKEDATNTALNAEAPVDLYKEGLSKFYNDDDAYFKSTFEAHLVTRNASDVQNAVRASKYSSLLPNTEYNFDVTTEAQKDRINAAFAAAKIHPRNLIFGENNVRWYNYVHHAHSGDEEEATQTLYDLLDGNASIQQMNTFRGYLPITNIPLLRERFEVSDYDMYRSDFGTGMGPLEVINPTNLKHAWSHGNPVDEVRHNKYGRYLEEVREKRRARALHPVPDADDEDLTEEVDFGLEEEPHRGTFKKLTGFVDPRLHYQHLFNRGEAEERKQKEELLAMLEEDEKTIEMMQRYNDQRAAALRRKNKLIDLESGDDSQATVVSDQPTKQPASFKSRLHHSMRINSSSFGLKNIADVENIDNINFDNSVNEVFGTRVLSREESERIAWDMRFLLGVIAEKGGIARFANRVFLILYNTKLRILQVQMQEEFKEESLLSKLPYHEEVYKKEAERKRKVSIKPSKKPSEKHANMYAIEESSGDESSDEEDNESEEEEDIEEKEEATMVKPDSLKKEEVKEKAREKELIKKAKSTALVPAKKKKSRTGATSLNINIPDVVKSFDFGKIKSRFFEDENGHLKIPYNGDVQKYVSYVIQFFKEKDWASFQANLVWFAKKIYSELEYYTGVLIHKAQEIDFDYEKVISMIRYYMMKAAVISKPLANYAIEAVKKVPRLVKSDEFRGGLLKVLNFLVLCIGELKKYSGQIVQLANYKSILYNAAGKVIKYSGTAIKGTMSGGTKLITTAGKGGVMLLK